MVLIIGGAFQGKTEYAKALLPEGGRMLCHYEETVRRQILEGRDPVEELQRLLAAEERNAPLYIVADEVGRGVVPLERTERVVRDEIGRTLIEAAKAASAVYRVTCGIGERIK